MFAKVFLNAKEEKEIQQGFPWVFDNEISHLKYRSDEKNPASEWLNLPLKDAEVADGSLVEVFTKAGGFLGSGILNKKSKITVRLLGNDHADRISEDREKYFEKRVNAHDKDFANAREVRNYFEETVTNQANRLSSMEKVSDTDILEFRLEDLPKRELR